MMPNGLAALSEAFSLAAALAQKHEGTGVLLLTASLQLLYMNRDAKELIRSLNNGRTAGSRHEHGVLPYEVMELCGNLANQLKTHVAPADWEQMQCQRVIGTSRCAVLVSGFGIPHRVFEDSRLFILMEELHVETEYNAARVQDRYRLTDREQTIIIYLIQGLTNKEIADRLALSEYTVKQHLKRIMQKTGTTTRTGVMARIVFASPSSNHALAMQKRDGLGPS